MHDRFAFPAIHRRDVLRTGLLVAASGLLLDTSAPGQDAPAAKADSTPPVMKKVADLAARYHFTERYVHEETMAGPGLVGTYRVATREVVRESVEAAQGAPRRTDSTRQAIFSERLAESGFGGGSVGSTVRSYERFLVKTDDVVRATGGKPLEGASVLIRPRSGELPLVLSLTEGRTLTEFEFDAIAHQPFSPHLAQLMPTASVRLGDTWRVPRPAAQALLGDPTVPADGLSGKLFEVRKEVEGSRMVALVAITGKVAGPFGETIVNAEVQFQFIGTTTPKTSTKKVFPPHPFEGLTEARGAVTEVRLASETKGPVPGPGRLRFLSNREFTLHRQLGLAAGSPPPPTFEKPPEPTPANSWLTHLDSSGRYSLTHPQELLAPDPNLPVKPGITLLTRLRRDGRDMLQVEFVPKTLAPEDIKKALAEKYSRLKMDILQGEEIWLPEADWPGVRVHRIDAALKVGDPKAAGPGGATRIHFDGYLIQFPQLASVLAIATTAREAVSIFRDEVEKILKTIKIDPPRPISG
jgi:hypothetical protein